MRWVFAGAGEGSSMYGGCEQGLYHELWEWYNDIIAI